MVACVCVRDCVRTYPNINGVLDLLLLLLRVVVVIAHKLWLQHITRASVQTEKGAV